MSTDKAADRPSVTDNARAELRRDLLADYDSTPGLIARGVIPDPDDDVHHECGRPWETHEDDGVQMLCPDPAETTTATTEDAHVLAVLNALHPKAAAPSLDYWGTEADKMRAALRAAGLLATARTRPTREQVIATLAQHDPENTFGNAGDWYYESQADAVLALWADQPTAADVWDQAADRIEIDGGHESPITDHLHEVNPYRAGDR